MKILVVANLYEPYVIGGGEISTKLLAEQLMKSGNDVSVLSSYKEERKENINGVDVLRIRNNIYWSYEKDKQSKLFKILWHILDDFNFVIVGKIRKILSENNYDILISSTLDGFSGVVWREAKILNIKTVHILRSYSLVCLNAGMYKDNHNCRAQCTECYLLNTFKKKYSNKYVDGVIGISNNILKKHKSLGYFKNSKNIVIYNSINLKKDFIEKNDSIIKVGYVGSIAPKKGVELLLKNFQQLKSNQNCELYLFGNPIKRDYLSYLKQSYNQSNVFFPGYKSQDDIFTLIDFLVVPSLWAEPFGRIVIEAYNYGIPVVGSNRGGIPELIEDNITGYLFNPDDEYDLLKKINLMLINFRNMKLECFARAKSFAVADATEKLQTFLEQA